MLLDLHAYSKPSGGQSLDDLIAEAQALGIDGVCVVDREASGETANRLASGEETALPVFVGVELPTRSGDVLVFVPELDPFLTREEWRQLVSLQKPEVSEVLALAEAEGGVVLLAHPYDRDRKASPRDRLFALPACAGAEVGTAASAPRENRTALEAVGRSALPAFGGSAARAGRGRATWLTLLARPVATQQELVDTLRAGDFWPVEVGETGSGKPRRRGRGRRN